MTIMYSNPVLCAILGWALRGERVGILGTLGIVVTLLGVVFVAQPPVIFGGHEWSHARMAGAHTCNNHINHSIWMSILSWMAALISKPVANHEILTSNHWPIMTRCHGKKQFNAWL